MRRTALIVVAAVVALAIAAPASAITSGEIDGNRHPNVAMMVFYSSAGRFRCSATLVSPTVLVTAAHCTDDPVGKVIATFNPVAPTPTPRATDDTGNAMSAVGYQALPAGWAAIGTPHAHPLWDGELQLNDLHDVGVVVLDQAVTGITPAELAPIGYLDELSVQALHEAAFETVGYGVFFVKPAEGPKKPTAVSDVTRRFAIQPGQNVTSQTLKLSESDDDSRGTGGTCFGDSGGPTFHDGLLVADTSFGASQFCRGFGGYNRLDTVDARSFLDDFLS